MKKLLWLPAAAVLALGGCKDETRDFAAGAHEGVSTAAREPADKTATRAQVDEKKQGLPEEVRDERAQAVTAKRDSEEVPGVKPLGNALRRNVQGTVASASERAVELKSTDDQSMKLAVDSATKVKIDGKTSRASQIVEGSQIRAAYKNDGAGLKALELEVTSARR